MIKPGSRRLIVTLDVPESATLRIGALDSSGSADDAPDREFVALVEDYEVEECEPICGHALISGPDDPIAAFELDDDPTSEFAGRAESHWLICPETLKLILGHPLSQKFSIRRCEDQSPAWEVVLRVRMLLH